jgi:AcrR family transcriptional regulator
MQTATPTGRRDRKKNRTRQDLVDAATKLFATRGFDETTTEDIAEAADVSQRTFFRHFPSKEAVLYGDMDDLLVRFREILDSRPSAEPLVSSVRESILALADDYDDQRKLRLLQARLASSYPSVSAYSRAVVQHAWEMELAESLGRRMDVVVTSDPRPEIIAAAAMAAPVTPSGAGRRVGDGASCRPWSPRRSTRSRRWPKRCDPGVMRRV